MGDLSIVTTALAVRGKTSRRIVPIAVLAAALLAGGCAKFSPDAGLARR
jgi:hypothetical protein